MNDDDFYFGVFQMYFAFNVTCWESFYVYVFRWNYTFGGGIFTTFADFIGHLSLCFA